jgi:hypothetical protein
MYTYIYERNKKRSVKKSWTPKSKFSKYYFCVGFEKLSIYCFNKDIDEKNNFSQK